MSKVLVIGSINVDRTFGVDHIPVPGETILGELISQSGGGKGANQAYAAARLGADVTLVGMVGADEDGKRSIESLESAGIDVSGIGMADQATGQAAITLDSTGQNTIVVIPGANLALTPRQLAAIDLSQYHIILLQLEIPMETIDYVLRNKPAQTLVILDPAPVHSRTLDLPLMQVDLLTPNETELTALSGHQLTSDESIVAAATGLIRRGVRQVLVTLGSRGAVLVDPDSEQWFEAKQVVVVDSTAAGDTFNGALAAELAREKPINQAILFAMKAAAIAVTRAGAQSSIPLLEEVTQADL